MNKIKKNNFLFIILASIITLVLLVVGALTLYKDNSKTFTSDGYIIETTKKTNTKYYFKGNTKYKANVDKEISFSNTDSKEVSVDPASFVHYLNGNISFLQRGALVNLADLKSPMVPYYNITNDNTIIKEKDNYTVTSNDKKINIDSFVGRISDNKYIVAGNNIELKIPTKEDRISGEYFEILYIEEGIVKIDNQEASYQVTAQDSFIYVGDNITISLGDGKIFYDGDAKMLLSQITINGNENINLDKDDGTGTGESGEGGGADGESGEGSGSGNGGEEGEGTDLNGTGLEGTGTGKNDGSGNGDQTTASPQIELIEAEVTSTTIDLSMQLNNANLAKGNIIANLTNVQTGERVYSKNIDLVNGTFKISKESLSPSTEYALTIIETGGTEKQYFQKVFKTKDLGLSLEKSYATDTSLSYKINFDEITDISRVKISIFDSNGKNNSISPNEFTVSKNDADTSVTFNGLKSNSSYSVSIDTVWINNAAYSNVYTINRIDSTLKETPTISGVNVETNSEEVKFTIKLDKVTDKDKSIVSYTYNFYKADDITLDNDEPEIIYSTTKTDTDALIVDLNQINELKTGTDYRCKIVAQYNDNEMIREVSTDYSSNFLIRSKPSINFELDKISMNNATGKLSLVDANCTVPVNGRSCLSGPNNFTLRYYRLKDGETTENDTAIYFSANDLSTTIELPTKDKQALLQNTTYAIKVFGNYYDDDNVLHTNVQIGDAIYITTEKSPELHMEVIGDNKSGYNKDGTKNINNVITFDAKLVAPQEKENIATEIATITLNLYSGRYTKKEKLIGTYTMNDKTEIENFFSNKTITNSLFTTKTGLNLNTIENLIKVSKYCPENDPDCKKETLNRSYTIEVEDVYTELEKVNKIKVDDNIYTFDLTPEYYLDSRIEIDTKNDPSKRYITVTPIEKQMLTDEEYQELKKTIKNLDDLKDETVVGVTLENTLSDLFVDSAFTYEKVDVNYTIEANGKKIKTIVDDTMGNKYQPKSRTVYLDPSELDDGTNFTRGYNYKFGYELHFTTEDGENPVYKNDKLYKNLTIDRQNPDYTQYISTSDSETITYRYNFTDIDNALSNNNFYYTIGDSNEYKEIKHAVNTDGEYHTVSLTFTSDSNYKFYYQRKGTTNNKDYISIDEYKFEKEKIYNNENSFELINRSNNNLTIKLLNNDFTKRAAAYKVVIKADGLTDYIRYFLSSKLDSIEEDTGELDEEGNNIKNSYKYIAIDYANISQFLKRPIKIIVYSYYENGLVGYDQDLTNGLILSKSGKYLNIQNNGSGTAAVSVFEGKDLLGINYLNKNHTVGDASLGLYNKLIGSYNAITGSTYVDTGDTSKIGATFTATPTMKGMKLVYNDNEYESYNARLLSEANLKTNNNNYIFNEIIPTINVTTNSTINSIKVNISPSGIYGNDQFKKDNTTHNKVYIDFYSDENLTNKLTNTPLTSDVHINTTAGGYTATIDSLEYKDLDPATKYYFTVYAYINNTYTRLFDSSSNGKYITKTYSSNTLEGKDIVSNIIFKVVPDSYDGETSRKKLTWSLNLKNTENYKLRFELFNKEDKKVNFDGSSASSCDINNFGNSSDGYISGCYISVPKEDISTINYHDQYYYFTGNDFVFGDDYYKLVIYAIPYTNNEYRENQKVTIYKNESLKNINNGSVDGINQTIEIPFLKNPEIKAEDLTSGYSCRTSNSEDCQNGYYYIQFATTIKDDYKVMKNGQYKVILKDSLGNIINTNSTNKCKYYIFNDEETINNNDAIELDECSITVNGNTVNSKFRFVDLNPNTQYLVELTYDTYRNNVNFSDEDKIAADPYNDTIYTPSPNNITTIGYITASQISSSKILLTHNAASPSIPSLITKVNYTISLLGTSSKVTGSYTISDNNPSLFTIGSNKTLTTTIDLEESSNPNFMIKSGNNYLITTQYYYKVNGEERLFEDGLRNINNFTINLQ